MVRFTTVAASIAALSSSSDALRMKPKNPQHDLSSYTFEKFVAEFGRDVVAGSADHEMRSKIFELSLVQIRKHNSNPNRLWTAGVHKFMDWNEAERKALNGYKPNRNHRGSMAALQTNSRFGTSMNSTLAESYQAQGPPIRNQGNCGSCWAISAAEAVEAQLMQSGHGGAKVSAQALVDCVPNPQHCGGSGGCDGATGELAYSFMKDYGIPMDGDLRYTAKTESCPIGMSAPWPASQRVRVSGWNHISPNNKAEPLMQSIVNNGPTVVAVDANNWFDYESGIFDGCDKDATLGHAVLAVGYGQDQGKKYWTIQNSWGADWGENGFIRILKHEDEDSWCGQDKKPQEGEGCDGGPSEVTVCGTCGILYDPLVPEGARIEGDSALELPAPVPAVKPETIADTESTATTAAPKADDAQMEGLSADEKKQLQALLR
jgi:cathepsin L